MAELQCIISNTLLRFLLHTVFLCDTFPLTPPTETKKPKEQWENLDSSAAAAAAHTASINHCLLRRLHKSHIQSCNMHRIYHPTLFSNNSSITICSNSSRFLINYAHLSPATIYRYLLHFFIW